MNSILTTPSIEEFARLVTEGIDAWTKAGKILNSLIEQDETVRVRIMERIPWMTARVLDGFERMGREEIYPQLLLDRSEGAHALIALPYEEQKRLHSASIAIAVCRKGEITTEHRRLQEMTGPEVKLAFTETALRPIAEQSKILLAKLRSKSMPVARTPREPSAVEEEDESTITEPLDDDPTDTAGCPLKPYASPDADARQGASVDSPLVRSRFRGRSYSLHSVPSLGFASVRM